jgi:hypothetical protein
MQVCLFGLVTQAPSSAIKMVLPYLVLVGLVQICVGYEHAKVFGGIYLSYYYVDIHVGTPPER